MSGDFDTGSSRPPLVAQPVAVGPVAVADDAAPTEEVVERRLGVGFWVAIGWLVLITLLAIFADWLPLKDPSENYIVRDLGAPPYAPSTEFWFGSDRDARDMFARTIYGARTSLIVGSVAIACGMLIGGFFGVVAGYFRGWWDRIISFGFLVFLSFPALVLAVLITSFLERNLVTVSAVLGLVAIAPIGRLARATTILFADREFVTAARTLGASHTRIMIRELLPNVVIPMGALALLGMAVAIVAEGGLAFLGLSVEQGLSWGTLISNGSSSSALADAPWIALAPIGVLFCTVAALNFAGDRIRDYFDVKELSL